MDSILIDFNVTKELGLPQSIVIAYIYHHTIRGHKLDTSTRALAKHIPLSKSTIALAIKKLITDTYLTNTEGSFTLSPKFFKTFNYGQ